MTQPPAAVATADQTVWTRLLLFLESIKFSHSVFALPFALVSMLLAAGGLPGAWTIFWIIVACVAARTAAMTFNRLADATFDARNPRTAQRALVAGQLSPSFMSGALLFSAAAFILSAGMLNRTCLILSVPTLAFLLGYSFTKRFTDFSHFFLGAALGLAPIGAWLAVTASLAWTPVLLGAAVLCWVGGFDILYSCQDYDIDRTEPELHSMPKRLGIAGAMDFAQKSHAVSLVFFFLFWVVSGLGVLTLLAVASVGALLIYQHRLVAPGDLSRINAAFFNANGLISLMFFFLAALDVLAF